MSNSEINDPMNKNEKQVRVEGLDEEYLQKAQEIYKEAEKGVKMIPEDNIDFSSEGVKEGAEWAFRLTDTMVRIILDQARKGEIGLDVAITAIQTSINDALVGVSRETLFDYYENEGGNLAPKAAEQAIRRAKEATGGSGRNQ